MTDEERALYLKITGNEAPDVTVVKTSRIWLFGFYGWSFGHWVFVTNDNVGLLMHEAHHVTQRERDGLLKFCALYLWDLLTVGYQANRYEVECRTVADRAIELMSGQ